jgi:hypothetical protein
MLSAILPAHGGHAGIAFFIHNPFPLTFQVVPCGHFSHKWPPQAVSIKKTCSYTHGFNMNSIEDTFHDMPF